MSGSSQSTRAKRSSGAVEVKGTGKGGAHSPAIIPIDPSLSRPPDSFPVSPGRGAPSPWRDELERMVELANDGEVEIGRYYLIGTFKSANGAANRKAGLEDSTLLPTLVLYRFDFKVESTPVTSELWVALLHRETVGAQVAREVGQRMRGLS